MQEWRYENHMMVPKNAGPHDKINTDLVNTGEIWNYQGEKPWLVRWTSDFDCGYETQFWYCIKDDIFDIRRLKAKRRYEITKGERNFFVKIIDPALYKKDILIIQEKAYADYKKKIRILATEKTVDYIVDLVYEGTFFLYGAFSRKNERLCGYLLVHKLAKYWALVQQKVEPDCEKDGINAVLIHAVLSDADDFLREGGYVCDGMRNIRHKTNFQEYLEKYFQFRKAYCKLHVIYHPWVAVVVRIAWPFRRLIKNSKNGLIYNFYCVLLQETIRRSFL